MKLGWALALGLLSSSPVHANEGECLAGLLVLDRQEVLHYSEPSHLSIRLPSTNSSGKYFTHASLHWLSGPGEAAAMYLDHVLPPPQTVGLPYNIYKIHVEIGSPESQDFWVFEEDYTKDCSETGRSFFPGELLRLPAIKVPPKSDGSSRDGDSLRIKIWGHL